MNYLDPKTWPRKFQIHIHHSYFSGDNRLQHIITAMIHASRGMFRSMEMSTFKMYIIQFEYSSSIRPSDPTAAQKLGLDSDMDVTGLADDRWKVGSFRMSDEDRKNLMTELFNTYQFGGFGNIKDIS